MKTDIKRLTEIERIWSTHLDKVVNTAITTVLNDAEKDLAAPGATLKDEVKAALLAAVILGIETGFRLKSECPYAFVSSITINPDGIPTAPKAPTAPKDPKAPTPKKEPLN